MASKSGGEEEIAAKPQKHKDSEMNFEIFVPFCGYLFPVFGFDVSATVQTWSGHPVVTSAPWL